MWAPHPNKRDEMWMFPGNHEYNFEFELPNDLPDTLEDSRSRHICYNNEI